ncbi:hypothetical protein [Trichormus azollae]|uniref:hypothetical protein n=1 Tax=Trichormus azollae TaxID=1164 RepID=UPI00325F468C
MKGEKGQPEIKAKNKQGFTSNHSSEKERQTPKKDNKGSKKASIKIDREEIVEYPQELLPADAQFKGYEEVIIQDIILATDNVLYRKEKYYSPLEGKTYLAERPCGYEGEFGLGIKTLIISLYYGGNITQGKLLEFLEDIDLLEHFQLPTKWKTTLQVLPQETVLSEAEFHTLLDTHLPKLGLQQQTRIMEAVAIAFSHQQTD